MSNVRSTSLFASLAVNLLCVLAVHAQSEPVEVSSPDHRIALHFAIKPAKGPNSADGQLVYTIDFRGKPLFEESGLRLELAGQPPLGAMVHFAGEHSRFGSQPIQVADREGFRGSRSLQ